MFKEIQDAAKAASEVYRAAFVAAFPRQYSFQVSPGKEIAARRVAIDGIADLEAALSAAKAALKAAEADYASASSFLEGGSPFEVTPWITSKDLGCSATEAFEDLRVAGRQLKAADAAFKDAKAAFEEASTFRRLENAVESLDAARAIEGEAFRRHQDSFVQKAKKILENYLENPGAILSAMEQDRGTVYISSHSGAALRVIEDGRVFVQYSRASEKREWILEGPKSGWPVWDNWEMLGESVDISDLVVPLLDRRNANAEAKNVIPEQPEVPETPARPATATDLAALAARFKR